MPESVMKVKRPAIDELGKIAEKYRLELAPSDLLEFREVIASVLESYDRLGQLPEPRLALRYPRLSGTRPSREENRLNAWYWRTEIRGASSGLLSGKVLAVKDNVCVAGVPMMNGTSVLEGYVPEIDATVVTRILDAGGTIAGKAVCESLCLSGGSHTSDTGPVLNPYDLTRTSGGSSSGSAALVATGQVDMAIGGDQGGSIRIPSSWCGICGLKPTYGLVPYTGIFPIEMTLDHVGPMARTPDDVALLLEVIAGPDGLDPRQHANLDGQGYSQALTGEVKGIRLGIVEEGFRHKGLSEKDVDSAVTEAAHSFERLGCQTKPVSIPWHREGPHIWNAIALEGTAMFMVAGNSMGTNWKGYYSTSLLDAFARGRLTRGRDLSETVKLIILIGQYMQDAYHGRYYAKAQNLSRRLHTAYEEAFKQHDLLVMPTVPMKATVIPPTDAPLREYIARALEMGPNTMPFDVTGHPAMTVPCTLSNGLPVGMMIVGRLGDDLTVLRAADAFAKNVFSPPLPRE
jgi:amidase